MKEIEIFHGALAVFSPMTGEFADRHSDHGLTLSEWLGLTSDKVWTPGEAREAFVTLDKVLSASLTIAGLGQVVLPAEFVAVAICRIVKPCNWLSAASSGRQYMSSTVAVNDDGVESKAFVTAERLFTLVLLAHKSLDCLPEIPPEHVEKALEIES
jgi:hypothetical protein